MSIYTADEVLSLPIPEDISGYELVNGQLVPVSFSGLRHGWLAGEIGVRIHDHVRERRIAERTYLGTGYVLGIPHDPERLRGPDVSFVSTERLQRYGGETHGFLHRVPDLAVQIESADRPPQLQHAILDYLDAGIPLLWVIHSEANSAAVFHAAGSARLLRESDALDGEDVLPGLKISTSCLTKESADGPMTNATESSPALPSHPAREAGGQDLQTDNAPRSASRHQ